MLLYIFNPVAIVFSSMWGMFDAIPTLFALLSVLYLTKNSFARSGIMLGMGIGFKGFFPFLLLPFFSYYVWRKERKMSKCIEYIVCSLSVPLLVSAPYLMNLPTAYLNSLFLPSVRLPQNLTYWLSLRFTILSAGIPITYLLTVGFVFFVIAFPLLYFFITKKMNAFSVERESDWMKLILRATIILLLTFFSVSTIVNEQYLVWVLPFLILYGSSFDKTIKPFLYGLCTLDIAFVAFNIGPRFFSPIIEMPSWWNNFQYTQFAWLAMSLTGILFSVMCIITSNRLIKPSDGGLAEEHGQQESLQKHLQ